MILSKECTYKLMEQNRKPEIDPTNFHLIVDKGAKEFKGKQHFFQVLVLENQMFICRKQTNKQQTTTQKPRYRSFPFNSY